MKRSLSALRRLPRRPGRPGAVLVAVVILAAGTAFAVSGPRVPAASRPVHTARTDAAISSRERAEVAALTRARSTGRPVVVASLTTELSRTVANPNETLTRTDYAQPVRVRQHGSWQPVNADLRRNASGALRPQAAASGVSLSSGGTGPLAVLTSVTGQRLSLFFPARLPAPAISGATATYRSVWPETDLQVTVTTLGGIAWTVIVRTASAAANPALRHLKLRTVASGLTVSGDHAGNLRATGPGGIVQFSGPPTTVRDATVGASAHAPRSGLLSAAAGYPVYLAASVTPDTTDATGATGVTCTSNYETENEACSGSNNGFVEVQGGGTDSDGSACTSNTYYDISQGDSSYPGNGIGYNWWDSYCNGPYRSFYQFDTSGLDSSMWVQSSTLYAWVRYGADWNCGHTWPVSVKWTGPISSSTDWSNQPTADPKNQTRSTTTPSGPNPNSTCSEQTLNLDVTYAMADAATSNNDNMTFGFYGDETASSSTSNVGFMRIGNNPDIITIFDLNPPTPTNETTSPAGHYEPGGPDRYGCGAASDNLPWINATDLKNGASQLSLSAVIQSAITDEPVRAGYKMQDGGTPIANPAGTDGSGSNPPTSGMWSNWETGVITTSTPLNFALQDGHKYTWTAQAFVSGIPPGSDPGYWSTEPPSCGFNVDSTPPTEPTVTSTVFPAAGSGKVEQYAGTSGTFNFASTDPAPGCSGCAASGVYSFAYSLNAPVPTSDTDTTQVGCNSTSATSTSGIVNANASGTATSCPVSVGLWGTNILYVEALDKAGNVSASYHYYFYVPWNPNTKIVPGDVNGDGIPDLLTTDNGGDLTLYLGNTDPSINPETASTAADSPDGTSWVNYQITHRDPMSQVTASAGIDDLFAQQGNNLYLYKNNPASPGAKPQFANTAAIVALPRPACTPAADDPGDCTSYTTRNWSSVSQILDPGDAWNPTPATAGSASSGDTGQPSLLTVENGALWLYQGNDAPGLQDPVELGSSGWDGVTLVAPGTVGGRLTIWAYDDANGNLYSYPVALVDGVPALSSNGTPVTATSGSVVFNYPDHGDNPAVASPGALANSSFPGIFFATPAPPPSYVPGKEPTLLGSRTDPTAAKSCGNGCLWYYPGQSTSGGAAPLVTTPIFVGNLYAKITQLS